jgi:transmembrane sensor
MSERAGDRTRALDEAAAWFAKLSRRSVTTETLRAFRAWRRTPVNRDAYEKVERAWATASALAQDPDIASVTRDAARPSRRRGVRTRLRTAAWTALTLACVVSLGVILLVVSEVLGQGYATGPAEQRIVRLEDGTVVRLNARSRMAVRFAGDERRVELKSGEALFEVTHDPHRPFRVLAGDARVTAIGTRFDVDHLSTAVQVTLLDGGLEVTAPLTRQPLRLHPNEAVQVAAGAVRAPAPATTAEALAWTEGRLIFKQTPLRDALLKVNRYARRPVRLAAIDLAQAPVSGVFVAGDTSAFAHAAAALFDLAAEPDGEGGFVLKRRASGRS